MTAPTRQPSRDDRGATTMTATREYYALTSLNPQMSGWHIVGIAHSKIDARALAETAIIPDLEWRNEMDIFTDTELKNLRVVSKTTARRRYGITEWHEDEYYRADEEQGQ